MTAGGTALEHLESPFAAEFVPQHSEPAGAAGAVGRGAPPDNKGSWCQVENCTEPLAENDARYYKVKLLAHDGVKDDLDVPEARE